MRRNLGPALATLLLCGVAGCDRSGGGAPGQRKAGVLTETGAAPPAQKEPASSRASPAPKTQPAAVASPGGSERVPPPKKFPSFESTQLPAAKSAAAPAVVRIQEPAPPSPSVTKLSDTKPAPAGSSAPLPPGRKYSGPMFGVLNWSGQLEKDATVTIIGQLPGVPVTLNLDTAEFEIAEAPAPGNGWNRIVVRGKNRRHTVVQIQWTVLQ